MTLSKLCHRGEPGEIGAGAVSFIVFGGEKVSSF
jgi:hypothetical protein